MLTKTENTLLELAYSDSVLPQFENSTICDDNCMDLVDVFG